MTIVRRVRSFVSLCTGAASVSVAGVVPVIALVYLCPNTAAVRTVAMACTLAACALAVALYGLSCRRPTGVVVAIGIAVGCLAGFLCLDCRNRNVLSYGIPESEVRRITCVALEDGTFVATRRQMVDVKLTASCGCGGETAEARGIVTLLVNSRQVVAWGEVLDAGVRLAAGDRSGGTTLLFADSGGLRVIGSTNKLLALRSRLRVQIEGWVHASDSPAGAMFLALLLGVRSDPDSSVYALFRQSGCMHILALSGMHLGIISAMMSFVLRKVMGRRSAYVSTMLFVAIYVFLAGPRPSLLRAACMYLLIGLGHCCNRRFRSIDVLSLSFLLLVVATPGSVDTLSFQLSFLALAGVLGGGRSVAQILGGYIPPRISYALACSVAAQICTAPILAATFGVVYPIGIFASLVLTPAITIFIWAGMGCLVMDMIAGAAVSGFLLRILEVFYRLVVSIARLFSQAAPLAVSAHAALAFAVVVSALFVLRYVWKVPVSHGTTESRLDRRRR